MRIVEAAEEDMYHKFDREVPTSFIGNAVSAHLHEIDKIAYVRFASVYRDFADVGETHSGSPRWSRMPRASAPSSRALFEDQTRKKKE